MCSGRSELDPHRHVAMPLPSRASGDSPQVTWRRRSGRLCSLQAGSSFRARGHARTVCILPGGSSHMAGLSLWGSTKDLKEAIGLLSYQWRTETCVSLTSPYLPRGACASSAQGHPRRPIPRGSSGHTIRTELHRSAGRSPKTSREASVLSSRQPPDRTGGRRSSRQRWFATQLPFDSILSRSTRQDNLPGVPVST